MSLSLTIGPPNKTILYQNYYAYYILINLLKSLEALVKFFELLSLLKQQIFVRKGRKRRKSLEKNEQTRPYMNLVKIDR